MENDIKFLNLLFILFIITACSTTESKNKLSSVHHLDEAANFLMLVSDEQPGLSQTCNLSSQEALNLLQPLHAMIDEQIKLQLDQVDENLLMNCEKECHCGIYSDLVSNSTLKQKLLKEAQETSKKKLVECANKSAKWLCDSNLIKKLKSESETITNGL
jgi:hypothetical protein